ncbi:MAG: hypothetical protein M1158_01895 [Candidatus Marsarchaeota archaeon]|nr:hypothetical protein [Candidatus Marsarchaeota archaeon]
MTKKKLYYLVAAFIVFIFIYGLYVHFGYLLDGDRALSNSNLLEQDYLSLFTWSAFNYSGLINITGSIPDILILLLFLIPYKLSIIFGTIVGYAFYAFVGLAGMFYLVYELTGGYSHRIRYFSSVVASVIFSFPIYLPFGAVAFLPWVFLFTKRLFYDKNSKTALNKLNLFGLVISIVFFISVGGDSDIILDSIILAFLGVLTLFFVGKGEHIRTLKYILLITLLSIAISAPWLIASYIFTNHVAHGFFSSSKGLLGIFGLNSIESLLAFGPGESSVSIPNIYTELILLTILLISLSSFAYIKKGNKNRGMILSILIMYIFMVGLATTILVPFGAVFSSISSIFPYLLTLRYVYTATHYVFIFLVATLFGLGIAYIMHRSNKKKVLLITFFTLLSVVIISYLYILDYIPIAMSSVPSSIPQDVNIPQHVFQIANYINLQHGLFTIATIPVDSSWQLTTWYAGVSVYSSLINKPVYTGGYSFYSEIFFPVTENEYFDAAETIQKDNMTGIKISNLLGVFGIHYLIVQGDALNYSVCDGCYVPPFNKTQMRNNLNGAENISLVGEYGNSSLYVNNNYDPLVYAAGIENLDTASYSKISSAIENETFDIQTEAIYSTSEYGLFNSTGKMNVTPIVGFSQPEIQFSQDTPTHVTVHVLNATTPFYLVFRETYDPYWHAYYSNGPALPQNDHISVNGFANAWYMNKTGNYTVTLYYTPQTIAWISWAVSFAALGVTCYIGFLGYRQYKQQRGRSR